MTKWILLDELNIDVLYARAQMPTDPKKRAQFRRSLRRAVRAAFDAFEAKATEKLPAGCAIELRTFGDDVRRVSRGRVRVGQQSWWFGRLPMVADRPAGGGPRVRKNMIERPGVALTTATARLARILSVSERTICDWLSRVDKDAKEARDKKIVELWLACYTQEEIAEAVGSSVQPIKDVTSDLSANLPENLKPAASHLTDFDPPLYNIWKQQEKTTGSSHYGNSEVRWVDNLLYRPSRKACTRA